jgi:Phosphoesterase family/IPT/TIG domain
VLGASAGAALAAGPEAFIANPSEGAVTAPASPPSISGFSPASGIAGSTIVTITGANLAAASAVRFNGVTAAVSSDTGTSVKAIVPNGATSGKVSVTTPGGTATSSSSFDVTFTLASFAPASGPSGTDVTITGNGFTSTATVKFHGVPATVASRTLPSRLVAVVPASATSGPITVTNTAAPAGTVTSASPYTVTPHNPPTITSFTPSTGITGSSVTITGTFLSGASRVEFDNRAASYVVESATQIKATVPNAAATGKISVTTAVATATSATSFTPTLSITGFTPAGGPPGTHVTISGVGFTSSSTVKFSGVAATVASRSLPSELVAVVPASATNGAITVTNTAAPAGTVSSATAYNTEICGSVTTPPKYKHVIMILEENHSYGTIVGSSSAPYINSLISACGVATNYHNITHESLPNYIGMTSGLTLSQLNPFLHDCSPSSTCESSANNVYDQVVSANGWKGYAESMPTACDTANAGFYAPRHNPAVYYTDLTGCATDDVPLGTTSSSPLLSDFSSEATAPSFAFVTPNVCDDMHGTTGCPNPNLILAGDDWLKQWLPLITSTTVYKSHDTAIFIVWDEGESSSSSIGENCATNTTDQSCHVPALVIAPSVRPRTTVSTLFNHYSLLKTTEDLLGVPELDGASTATSMAAAFGL